MILVTGGTGLVGGHLLWQLLQENDRIAAIRRPSSDLNPLRSIFSSYTSKPDDFFLRIEWRIGDVLNEESIRDAMSDVTLIYHCAAVVSLANNTGNFPDTNVQGTHNIVKTALEAGVKKLCFVSSISACGKSSEKTEIDENSIWSDSPNRSRYSRSKYYSEQEVWKGIRVGLNAVIVNPGVILGVSGNDTGSSQLFSRVQKGLLFYTNGGTGYVDVKDVVIAMIQLMKSNISGERYVLVGENCSNKEILGWMAEGFGRRRPFIVVGKRLLWLVGILSEFFGKVFRFQPLIDRRSARTATIREYYSNRKIKSAIGINFTTLANCIQDVCDFRMKNQQQ
jgi:nucleoside-diphosphate-sugar epimerase